MRKNKNDREELISKSPKFSDCLSVPIGICGQELSEMRFSCRGRLGNINGYLVWGSSVREKTKFISNFLINACKKYSPEELKISIYDNVGDKSLLALGEKLTHVQKSVNIGSWGSLLNEVMSLEKSYADRLEDITSLGEQCFAHAARNPDVCDKLNMSQEFIIFNLVTAKLFEECKSKSELDSFFRFITQKLWRAGIYPVFVRHDDIFMSHSGYEYYFPNVIVLGPNITHYKSRQEIGIDQVLNYTGWDSWNINAEREEVVDLPNYTDEGN